MIKNLIGIAFALLALIFIYAGVPDALRIVGLIILFVIQLFTFSIFETIRIRKERLAAPSEHQPFSSFGLKNPRDDQKLGM